MLGGTQGIILHHLHTAGTGRTRLSLKSGVRRRHFAPGNGAELCAGEGTFRPLVLPAGTRRLSRPAARPRVSWGPAWVQHVWHLVMDPNASLSHILHVRAHPAHADAGHLEMGTASPEQHEAGTV